MPLPQAGVGPLLDEADAREAAGPRGNVLVGTCSWTDASLIRSKRFYPRGCSSAEDRLRYYATQFGTVEVDSSFFAMPSASNATLWAQRTPDGFPFNIKAFRLLTGHQTPLAAFPKDMQGDLPPLSGRKKNYYYPDVPGSIRDELWRRYREAIAPLRAAEKLCAVHFQFAPWVTRSTRWMDHVAHCVERMDGLRVAVEFRNVSWFQAEAACATLAWERELGVVHVIVDEPQTGNYAHGVWATTSKELAVVRLHGRNAQTWSAKGLTAASERFNYEYTDAELQGLADQIRALDDVFLVQVLVNVNFEDQGVRAARRLHALLGVD